MKKIKSLTLSIKVMLWFTGIFIIVIACMPLLGFLLKQRFAEVSKDELINFGYIGITLVIILIQVLFSICVHNLIVKRLKRMNRALDEVVKGNYDIELSVKGNDVIAQLTRSFNTMASELKSNEYINHDFARNISHEFKTPLSVIYGYAELIEDEIDNNELKTYANIILTESKRLSDLSKTIMELSQFDRTAIIKQEDVFSPSEQIKAVLEVSKILQGNKVITIHLDLEEFIVKSNEKLLFRVWQNLISNAIKFINEPGEIHIQLSQKENSFIFSIKDNGIGINEENQKKLFTQFFVADASRNKEGSGLGLALTKKIIEKMGGHITFKSIENEGTEFIVECLTNYNSNN